MKDTMLFIIGFFQLLFLSANVYYTSRAHYPGIIVSCFMTNLVYSFVVTKLAISNWKNRIIYSIGCTFGCVIGVWLATKI